LVIESGNKVFEVWFEFIIIINIISYI
jgi:hypothetical protein